MRTSTKQPPVPADQDEQTEQTAAPQSQQQKRQEYVDALARKLLSELQTEERKKPPEERRANAALWHDARTQAVRQERRGHMRQQVRQKSQAAASAASRTAAAEARSVYQRNRHQLAPWLLASPYALVGTGGWALAQLGDGNPVGIAAVLAATSIGASMMAWRRWLAKHVPGKLAARARATLALLCAWSTLMPLTPSLGGMGLAWLAGTAYMALPWWREHEHPQPVTDTTPTEPEQPPTEPPQESQDTRRINGILHAWATKLAGEKGPVPGSSLVHVHSTDAVDRYRITLDDEGSVTRGKLPNLHDRIALALGVVDEDIQFEFTKHPATIIMRHLVGEPVTDYAGPVVLCNGTPISSRWEITPGANVDIVYGYYTDGDGMATYRILDAGSVNSMFVLGGTGSGKTRLLEVIAIALRFLGVRLWYVDGQEGASSTLLNEQADWAVSCTPEGVEDLHDAVGDVRRRRNQELSDRPELENEYSYDPDRPPVIVVLEEAHEVFNMKHTKRRTYGQAFGDYATQIRKCGIGFVAASQDFDATYTFGNSPRLRNSLLATGNFAAMRLVDKSRRGMLPSGCPKLETVPPKGFGFSPFAERPAALWRTPNLDGGAHHKRDWMGAYTPAPVVTGSSPASASTGGHDVESDAESGESTPGVPSGVLRFPGAGQAAPTPELEESAENAAGSTQQPTEAEQRVLTLLREEPIHTSRTAAGALGISEQAARKHVRNLASKRLASRNPDGTYSALV